MSYTLFYGFNRGSPSNLQSVDVGTSSTTDDIQLEIDVTHAPTREDVILALRAFEEFILSNGVGTTSGPGVDLPTT